MITIKEPFVLYEAALLIIRKLKYNKADTRKENINEKDNGTYPWLGTNHIYGRLRESRS